MAPTILLIFAFLNLPLAQEQTTEKFIGIPDKEFETHHRSLDEPNWYWAASVQMVLAYYQQKVTQKELMIPAHKNGVHPLDIASNPKNLENYTNGLAKDESGKRVILSCLQINGSRMGVVYNHLRRKQPLILLIATKKEVYAYVLTGADVELGTSEEKKFAINRLHVWTPYDFKTVNDWKGTRLEKDPSARKKLLRVKRGEKRTALYNQDRYVGDFTGVLFVLCEKVDE